VIGWSLVPEPPARMMPFMEQQHNNTRGLGVIALDPQV
jgi:hypothetical protein